MPNKLPFECPECGERLEVEEFTENYVIYSNDHAVTCCPGCLAPLIVHDGKLEIDQA